MFCCYQHGSSCCCCCCCCCCCSLCSVAAASCFVIAFLVPERVLVHIPFHDHLHQTYVFWKDFHHLACRTHAWLFPLCSVFGVSEPSNPKQARSRQEEDLVSYADFKDLEAKIRRHKDTRSHKRKHKHRQVNERIMNTYTYTYIDMYTSMYIYICVCIYIHRPPCSAL